MQPKCLSTDEWIRKMCICVHMHTCTHTQTLTHTHTKWNTTHRKKKERMSFVESWIDLEIVILSEASQAERYHLYVEAKK